MNLYLTKAYLRNCLLEEEINAPIEKMVAQVVDNPDVIHKTSNLKFDSNLNKSLNNVKYVNDNYGHEEGDQLIIKAASILVNTQLENSEVIRTDGNEFLIYLVGYSDRQIATYTKKLEKEMKSLPHEFGAAIGYSMITDEIKTLDDAINEATLEMITNKEEYRQEKVLWSKQEAF